MDRRYYRTGQFALKADVSIRTLRYYDKEGLLAPSQHSEAGYRLYTDEDLVNLQQILALKFLGFSLDEIKALLRAGSEPRSLADVLTQQKELMQAKRSQLDGIIQAISQTEKLLQGGECDWDSLVSVIQAIRMEDKKEWAKQYFTQEQLDQMQSISDRSYSPDARAKIDARRPEWTEADQERASAQWAEVNSDIARLSREDVEAAGAAAQHLAGRYISLTQAFTGGDSEIAIGLSKWWENFSALPEGRKPFRSPYTDEQRKWLEKALAVFRNKPGAKGGAD